MRHALAATVVLLAGCQGDLTTAEIDVSHLGVTLPAQAFPASDTTNTADFCAAPPQSSPPCIQTTLDYDLGAQVPALTNKSVTYDLRLTDVAITLSAASAGDDLYGVLSAKVIVKDLVTGADTVVASYDRPASATSPIHTLAVSGNASVDLGPYLDAGRLPVRVELLLTNGTPAFWADVHAGFSLVVNVDWSTYL